MEYVPLETLVPAELADQAWLRWLQTQHEQEWHTPPAAPTLH